MQKKKKSNDNVDRDVDEDEEENDVEEKQQRKKRLRRNKYQAEYMKRLKEAAALQPRNNLMMNERQPDFSSVVSDHRNRDHEQRRPEDVFAQRPAPSRLPPHAVILAQNDNHNYNYNNNNDDRRLFMSNHPSHSISGVPHGPPPPWLFQYMPRPDDIPTYYDTSSFRNEVEREYSSTTHQYGGWQRNPPHENTSEVCYYHGVEPANHGVPVRLHGVEDRYRSDDALRQRGHNDVWESNLQRRHLLLDENYRNGHDPAEGRRREISVRHDGGGPVSRIDAAWSRTTTSAITAAVAATDSRVVDLTHLEDTPPPKHITSKISKRSSRSTAAAATTTTTLFIIDTNARQVGVPSTSHGDYRMKKLAAAAAPAAATAGDHSPTSDHDEDDDFARMIDNLAG